jgi:hypothetical protein
LEGTLKKLALVASAATALVCAASLIATTPADAKKHHKKPAATTSQTAAAPGYGGPGGYNAGPTHQNGGPVRSGNMCWKDDGNHTGSQFGMWVACPK